MALSPIAQWLATNYTTMASSTAYPLQIDADLEVLARLGAAFAPSQTPTASMQIMVFPGHVFDGTTLTEIGQYTNATTVSGSASVAVARAEGIAVGQLVIGAGVPSGTTVAAVAGTTVTLSADATASASNVPLAFCQLSAAIAAPATGNNRIDRVVVSRSTGALSVVTGTSTSGAPTAPAVPAGACPVAQISLTAATSALTNASNIADERDLALMGLSLGAAAFLGLGTGLASSGGSITPLCAPATVSGAAHAYADGDRNQLLSRVNSGAAMTDSFGGASTPLTAGWATIIANADASANLTLTIQSGTGTGGFSSPGIGSGFVSSSTLPIPAGGIVALISQGNGVYIAWNMSLTPTGVTAGSYTNANVTIGLDGRVMAAANGGAGVLNSKVFTSSGTFTTPSNTISGTTFKFIITGGGGNGGAGSPTNGAGGGAAGTVIAWVSGLSASQNIIVTVGGSGTDSSITVGSTTLTAPKGTNASGAGRGNGGVPSNSSITGISVLNISGGAGQDANGGSYPVGSGGASYWGGGGGGGWSTVGQAGQAYGSGGGGGDGTGGVGAAGIVTVEWVL